MARKERVAHVIDGDTFRTSHRKRPVRLANVYAPERGERGAASATTALKKLVQGQTVSIETVARGPYGRPIVNVKVGRQSVNAAMRRKTSASRNGRATRRK